MVPSSSFPITIDKILLHNIFKFLKHDKLNQIYILYMMYTYNFSENFKDYQNFVSNNFGSIYDTKLLCKEVKRIVSKNGL